MSKNTSRPISKGEKLWSDYKKARSLRNKVSHTARKISKSDALFVIQTVKEWLYFLEGARDIQASNEEPDLTLEFLSLYAILASRFRFPKGTPPVSLSAAVRNATRRGELSAEVEELILSVVALRNKVAHGVPVPPEELASPMQELKNLVKKMKGFEIDGSPVVGD